MKTLYHILVIILSCLGLIAIALWGFKFATSKTCNSFDNHRQAQLLYDLDPVKYAKLDADHNGKACQNLKN